jgi:alcohol dehydrogenase
MQQLVFVEPGRVEWRDGPDPALLEPEDALVRLIAVATCDLDTGLVAGKVTRELPQRLVKRTRTSGDVAAAEYA